MRPELVEFGDYGFAIANMMRDCPAWTVIRELLQNAIEASAGNLIEWFVFEWNGTRKLSLYNEGKGMSPAELREAVKIASTSKELGHDKNFGMGAKMSAGKSSPHGLVYRTCRDGLVCQVLLRMIGEPGCKQLYMVPIVDEETGESATVYDVTEDARRRGRDVTRDWTEAILLGRSDADDTVSGAFLGISGANWLTRVINQRYYRFPPGVTIRNSTITSDRKSEHHRNARGLFAILSGPHTERCEVVVAEHPRLGPVEINYGRLAEKEGCSPRQGPLYAEGIPGGTHICIVWKDEIYDFDADWFLRAGAYGFSGVCERYYVHIRLTDEAPVKNTIHRQSVVFDDLESEAITCEWLCNVVRDNRPQWVQDDVESLARDDGSILRRRQRIRKMADRFKAKMDMPVVSDDGADPGLIEVDRGDDEGGTVGPPTPREPRPNGRSVSRGLGKALPRARPADMDADFKPKDRNDRWYEAMKGRAGIYDEGENKVWLSLDFSEYRRLLAWVDQSWPAAEENAQAIVWLNEEYCVFAVAFGIGCLELRDAEHWTPDQWRKVFTADALSAFMLDPREVVMTAVRMHMHRVLNRRVRERGTEAAHA